MTLRCIEISGFKTFPDKTVITAQSGVTAIVGPNGSGKSNIGDAVRWVLGEQNPRNLRCEKRMEEVIFHGTRTRSPLHFAEVTLILDDEDGTAEIPREADAPREVRITRRLFRSGESEYYINKTAVRLKDILELLMDTGLGQDGYSIIGQGRIGKILSDKAGDRRRVFEEACGISKYRHRKEESERKLASAEDNLLRIGDKIGELELQVEPLREQAATARRFLLLRDELRSLEIAVWLQNLERLKQSFGKVRAEYDEVSEKLRGAEAALAEQYAHSEQLSARNAELQVQAETEREALSSLETEMAGREADVKVTQARREDALNDARRIREEIQRSEGRESGLDEQIQERERQLAEHRAALLDNQNEIQRLLGELEALGLAADDAAKRLAVLTLKEEQERQRAAEAARETASLAAASEELTLRRQALHAERDSSAQSLETALAALREAQTAASAADEQIAELQNVVQGYTLQKNTREQKAQKLRGRADSERLSLSGMRQRFDMLREMEREHEGFTHAVKTVLNKASGLQGVHGTVADLIHTEDEYAVALETALGAALQNIVVSDEQDARAAIELLKRRDAGRATFLPVSSVRGRTLEEAGLENEPGFVGLGVDLARADRQYGEIFASLLGRTAVVTDLDAGIRLAKKRGYRFRIVTLDGQILNAGGAMTGGSLSKQTGILSRKNELESLSGKLETGKAALEALLGDLQNAERELSAVVFELNVALEERRAAEDAALQAKTEAEHRENWLNSLRKTQEGLQAQLETIEQRLEENGKSASEQRERQDACLAAAEGYKADREALAASNEGLEQQAGGFTERLAALREQSAGLSARTDADRKSVEDFLALKRTLAGDRAAADDAVLAQERAAEELSGQIETLQAEHEALRVRTEARRASLKALYEEQQGLEARRVQCDRGIRDRNEENTRYERDRSRLETLKASAENEEKQILDRLWETYGLTHTAAQEQRVETPNVQKAVRRIAELKKEINALGAVNIGAIDEFERVSGRFDYLTAQRDDAVRAKKELEGIIAEITGAMRDIFQTQFARINENFSATFLEIFGGGQAVLELEDPEDVLNCGVEIKAQPPGKKLRAITLLSGGEMSLVAIALYFAIFKVRPSPFCVLDEIDHDLDDVNVSRYARYLKSISHVAQFLVVTHRRGTMEIADLLYGVTAQEEGVSKILALRLDEVEKKL